MSAPNIQYVPLPPLTAAQVHLLMRCAQYGLEMLFNDVDDPEFIHNVSSREMRKEIIEDAKGLQGYLAQLEKILEFTAYERTHLDS